jgi:hypothetical protein
VFKGSGARVETLANSDCQVTKSKNLGLFADLAFFSNGITGGRLIIQKYFTKTSFIKVSCLKGFLLHLSFKF